MTTSGQPGHLGRREFMQRAAAAGLGLAGLAGVARAAADSGDLVLGNGSIAGVWRVAEGHLTAIRLEDRLNRRSLALAPAAFTLRLADGSIISAADLRVTGEPRLEPLAARPGASRLSERLPGRQLAVTLEDRAGRLRVRWRVVLRDGSAYLRQEVGLSAVGADLPIAEIRLVDQPVGGAYVAGLVKGSPIVAGALYFGLEHPLSDGSATADRIRCTLARELPVRAGHTVEISSVVGTTRPGQLRRDFLAYVERERAHPYRTFLHYNSWYDLGYFTRFSEPEAVAVIKTYGEELVRKRGVVLDSFLFDDGWDDPKTLWRFHSGFPHGFTPLRDAAAKYGTSPGVWLSPWGGYGKPKQERLAYGREQGFETNEGGFALSGPTYYARFRDTCLDMIRTYGVNQFKFDGAGNVDRTIPGSEFDSDFDAAIHLIEELRAAKPDLYVNLTTGTYPSPFWLRYADSIWRGGEDHDFAGVGTDRQRWITYRDADTFAGVVRQGQLYPLNALMLHGLIFAKHAHHLDTDPAGDFRSEIRDYFGTGTQLQEMYVTPSLLSARNWDDIAEAAKWSRRNADVLVDTHWIGGDPGELQPYGWASWKRRKGILTLRNPADVPQPMVVDLADAFELPPAVPRSYRCRSPWRSDAGRPSLTLQAGRPHRFTLRPFEVLTLEALPG